MMYDENETTLFVSYSQGIHYEIKTLPRRINSQCVTTQEDIQRDKPERITSQSAVFPGSAQ